MVLVQGGPFTGSTAWRHPLGTVLWPMVLFQGDLLVKSLS